MTPHALRFTCLAALVGLALPALAQPKAGATSASGVLPSAEGFRNPSREAGVHVWWHWLDGAITREGITKDLEAMKAQGVAQATILNVGLFGGRDFGVPRVTFASPEWFAMLRFALAEAHRLGIRIGVHNCDGWSSSGGPWITPELSMKQFAWTKTFVTGGAEIDVSLPRPAAVEGFYRDVAVVAYRTPQRPSAYLAASPRLQVNGVEEDPAKLTDGSPISGLRIQRGDRFVLSAKGPIDLDRVAVHVRRPFMWGDSDRFTTRFLVETSSDGRRFEKLAEVAATGLNRTQLVDVPHARAPFVRVTVREIDSADAWIPVELAELELLQNGETPAYAPTVASIGEKTSAVKGGDSAVYAAAQDGPPAVASADVLLLTDRVSADGRLRWTPPEGRWAVLRFGYTSTGARNGPATREGTGLECDKMDPRAVEHHFHAFPEKVIDEAGALAGDTLKFVLVDSWEAGFQNWTARLPEEFAQRRGYSLLPWLPVLTGETVGSTRESEAVLFDFRQTIADLIRESYYERLAALLHERGVELHAEVIYGGGGYPPLDVLRSTKPVDLPMFEFWTSTDDNRLLKYQTGGAGEGDVGTLAYNLPGAAAAGYGKPLLGSEAYTGYAHYSESPAELKPFGDRAYAAGINRMILHSSVHQPSDDKPGMTLGPFASHFNRNNLYWNHASSWLAYQARVQSVLGEGAPVFDVLYFLGDQLPQSYAKNASTAVPFGYTVDAVNAEILAERITVVNGKLQLNGRGASSLLSLPPQPYLSLATLKRVEALVLAGAHVYGPKPVSPLSVADGREAAAFRALADRVWGGVDGTSVFEHAYGKGLVSWGRPLEQVLAAARVAPQLQAGASGARDFLFGHRRVGDADVFFVANQWDRPIQRELTFRAGGRPEVWDPETGTIVRPAAYRVDGGRVTLPVRFAARQALLFVFRPGAPRPHVVSIARGGTPLFPAPSAAADAGKDVPQLAFETDGVSVTTASDGEFRFVTSDGRTLSGSFTAPSATAVAGLRGTLELKGPAAPEAPIEVTGLRSLTEYDQPGIRYFSGEATYRLRFAAKDVALASGERLLLDLGDFESVADVTLNGRPLGILWNPGTALDVTGALQPENELVVTVANVYRNRFIGDLAQYGEVRNLKTSSPIRDFLSADKPLKRAGLIGPLRVTRVPRQRVPGL